MNNISKKIIGIFISIMISIYFAIINLELLIA